MKPLLVLDQIWREILIDFVTDLPSCNSYTNLLMITDRLSKGVILELIAKITADTVIEVFLNTFY